jgi:ATP-binding protein involved in chromosome partitioning
LKSYRDIVTDGGSNVVEQVTQHAASVDARLALVDHVVAVMSGKGGVGKSTITANLAASLASRGLSVGILDADINSSSIARIMGVAGSPLEQTENGICPATGALGIKVMSVDLLLASDGSPVIWDSPTQKDAFTWRAMMEMAALREFLSDTDWGRLDYLLIDMPPGSDRLPNVADLIPQLAGSIVVTIPSAVARFVVEKSIRMAIDVAGSEVIGIVENMAYTVCSHCGAQEDLFPDGRVAEYAETAGVAYLARIPFDRRVADFGDRGESFAALLSDTPAGRAFTELGDRLITYCTQ